MICKLSPDGIISRRFITAAAIIFAIIISLWSVGEAILYCKRRYDGKRDGMWRPVSMRGDEIESDVLFTPGSHVRGSEEEDQAEHLCGRNVGER